LDALSYHNYTGLLLDQVLKADFLKILDNENFVNEVIWATIKKAFSKISYRLKEAELA